MSKESWATIFGRSAKRNWFAYYQANKEQIAEYKKETFTCICGTILRKCAKARHEKTIKHQNHLKNQLENAEKLLEKNITIENEDL